MINLPYNASLKVYLPQKKSNNKSILIIPGGGYHVHADFIEGEPIALAYAKKGFTAFVLFYSVKTTDEKYSSFPFPLLQAGYAVKHIRDNKQLYNVCNFVAVCGFSAGGHLAGMMGLLEENEVLREVAPSSYLKVDCIVLGYPVVSTEPSCRHDWSIDNLLKGCKDKEKLNELVCLEKRVKKNSPPLFVWLAREDEAVNINNSLLLTSAYVEMGGVVECHLFPFGGHGLGLATKEGTPEKRFINKEASSWFNMSVAFINKL